MPLTANPARTFRSTTFRSTTRLLAAWLLLATIASTAVTLAGITSSPRTAPAAADPAGTTATFRSPLAPSTIVTGPDGVPWFVNGTGLGHIAADGTITFVADPVDAAPTDLAVGPDGNVWYPSVGAVTRVTPAGITTRFAAPTIGESARLTAGADGHLWVTTSSGADQWLLVAPDGTTAGLAGSGDHPVRPVLGPDGAVWYTTATGSIARITPAGDVTAFSVGAVSNLLLAGPDGRLWFLGCTTCGAVTPLSAMATDGTVAAVADVPGTPTALTTGPDGNVWITHGPCLPGVGACPTGVTRVTPAGTTTTFPDGSSRVGVGIAAAGGDLWVSDATASIVRYTTAGLATPFVDPSVSRPGGIVSGPDGALWFTNRGNDSIGRITTDGTVQTWTDPTIADPTGLAVGPDGALWFTNRGATCAGCTPSSIGRITTAGSVQAFSDPAVDAPTAIVTGSDGNLWFANGPRLCGDTPPSIGRLSPGGTFTFFSDTAMGCPRDLVLGPDGAVWFTGAQYGPGGNGIGRITTTGAVTTGPVPSGARADRITVGPDARIWFTEPSIGQVGHLTDLATVVEVPTGPSAPGEPISAGADGAVWLGTTTRITVDGLVEHLAPPPDRPVPVADSTTGPDGRLWWTAGDDAIGATTVVDAARFDPVVPFRAADTRLGSPVVGPVSGSIWVQVAGVHGVPLGASAAVLQVTATEPTQASYLRVTRGDALDPGPSAAVLVAPGQTATNLVTAGLSPDGSVRIDNQQGTVQVVVDVLGYYDEHGTAGFTATTPARVLDSRTGTGGWTQPLGPGVPRELDLNGAAGLPADASAVVLDVTVTDATAASYLQAFPTGSTPGTTANLLFDRGQTVTGLVVVGLGSGPGAAGRVTFANQLGHVDLVADLVGWFTPGQGDVFHPVATTRVVDSRVNLGTAGPLGAGTSGPVSIGAGWIPSAAHALAGNLTVTEGTAASYVALGPSGAGLGTTASVLFGPGQTVPNATMSGLGSGATLDVFNQQGSVQVVVDAAGWFGPAPT